MGSTGRTDLSRQMEDLGRQVEALLEHMQLDQSPPIELLSQAFEELSITIEELQVAQEELYQQNEELGETRQQVEFERLRYQELFESAPDGYLVTDIHGKILDANKMAGRLLGLPPSVLVSKALTMFIAEPERRAFRTKLNQLPYQQQFFEEVFQFQPRSRAAFDAALTLTPIYAEPANLNRANPNSPRQNCFGQTISSQNGSAASPELLGWRWLIRDITHRKQLEAAQLRAELTELMNQALEEEIRLREQLETQLRQRTEALERANQAKDEFLAIVSHELRSPLSAILGWSQLLNQRQLDAETVARAHATIERNALAQTQLVEDLLDISRIIRGDLHLANEPVDLATVIQAALDVVRLSATAKQIEIELLLSPQPSIVSGDAARLQQVIWNLLSNAIKFTPPQGQVCIQLAQLDAEAMITVSDTGKGISPEFLPQIFDRFRQAEQSTTRSHSGLGLGLAIVRQLVELHGGTVQATSDGLGQGACFTVRLPLVELIDPALLKPAATPAELNLDRFGSIQVLVVEDQADTRALLLFALEQAGASVMAVGSVAEALAALEQNVPDVLVSDIGMPEADGYTLIERVRSLESEQARRIPAIALTAFARESDRTRVLASGFQMHLTKPVDIDQLIAAVATQFRQFSANLN